MTTRSETKPERSLPRGAPPSVSTPRELAPHAHDGHPHQPAGARGADGGDLAEAFGLAQVEVHPALLPHSNAHKRVVELASEVGPGWALVGHNPGMVLAGELALGEELPDKMHKGAVLALMPSGKRFTFAWLAAPGRSVLRPDSPVR